jgi:hypothetical protein
VKITPTGVIKDGGHRYNPGVEYDVDDETGRRFVILGWATSPDYTPGAVQPTPAQTDIASHSVSHTSTAKEV